MIEFQTEDSNRMLRDRTIHPGPFVPSSFPRRKTHSALVLAQDADHLRQDDYGEEDNGNY